MKLFHLASAALLLTAPFALAETSTWKSDAAHSEVDFTIKHLSVSNVNGRFGHVDATIVYDDKDVTKSTVKATIDVTGINTGESARDSALKADNFFGTDKFPSATFVSTSVAKGGSGLLVTGNLTIKGISKTVVLDVDGPATPVTSPMDKKLHSGLSATTTIHRSDFGIGAGMPTAMLNEDVKISIDLDIVKQ